MQTLLVFRLQIFLVDFDNYSAQCLPIKKEVNRGEKRVTRIYNNINFVCILRRKNLLMCLLIISNTFSICNTCKVKYLILEVI